MPTPITREKVIESIESLLPGAKNKAEKVQEILKDILNYCDAEKETTNNAIELFSIESDIALESEDKAKLYYSVRGIKEQFANFSFFLSIESGISLEEIKFQLNADEWKDFIPLIEGSKYFNFLLPLYIQQPRIKVSIPVVGNIFFENGYLVFRFLNANKLPDNVNYYSINTSICLHYPKMDV